MAYRPTPSCAPPPPPPKQSPYNKVPPSTTLPATFNAFPGVQGSDKTMTISRFLQNEQETVLWKGAMNGDVQVLRALPHIDTASIRPLEREVQLSSGEMVKWPTPRFLRWGLRHYVILQRMLACEIEQIEACTDIVGWLDEQEQRTVMLALAQADAAEASKEWQLLKQMCAGTLFSQRCSDPYAQHVPIWQAALGACDGHYFSEKLRTVNSDGVDLLRNVFEVQLSHARHCTAWPLRMFCRGASGPQAAEKLKILLEREESMVKEVLDAVYDDALTKEERGWLAVSGITLSEFY